MVSTYTDGNGPPSMDNADNQATERGPRRGPRIRLSCLRCQRRKIRCDGALPVCGSCKRSGVPCTDGDHLRGRDFPRAYITSLKNRVAWLESELRTRCPDFDLSAAPAVGSDETVGRESTLQRDVQGQTSTEHESQEPKETDDGTSPSSHTNGLAHQIGLVSLSGGTDPRYIGPSSGFFFAQLTLASLQQPQQDSWSSNVAGSMQADPRIDLSGLASCVTVELPSSRTQFLQIVAAYFDYVHLQWPFLHRPSLLRIFDRILDGEHTDPVDTFQVYMVLAISSVILGRRARMLLPTAGYFAQAMRHFEKIRLEASLSGLQCLLLLQVYTLYNPTIHMNSWYLNYQCIASVIDLGLQREIRAGKGSSNFTVELRRRIFWTVYSIDRLLATMMGRPIGLRDEAFDVELPLNIDDDLISDSVASPARNGHAFGHMAVAIHLFRLSQLNSEIKYVLHSISREPVSYARANVPDLELWQRSMLERLRQWYGMIQTPHSSTNPHIVHTLCETGYHSLVQVLLRPTPAIPSPSKESLQVCYKSAVAIVRLLHAQYRDDGMVYHSSVLHQLILSTVTMFHCIWNVPEIAGDMKVDVFMADCRAASNILSAAGEHYPGAKRSSGFLDELSSLIVRRIMERKTSQQPPTMGNEATEAALNDETRQRLTVVSNVESGEAREHAPMPWFAERSGLNTAMSSSAESPSLAICDPGDVFSDDFSSLFDSQGAPTCDFDHVMQGMFDGWFPTTFDASMGNI